jgi:phosphoglycerate dehydrogenase-like enzyme
MTELFVAAMENLPFSPAQWDTLTAAAAPGHLLRVPTGAPDALAKAVQEAEVLILTGDLDERHLAGPKLRWIHCDHAGLTKSARPAVFERDLIVTGSAGRSAPALAEHALMFMLALNGNLLGFHTAQQSHQWRGIPGMDNLRALNGRTIGIIGMGYTGQALAPIAKALGMRVLGYRRRDLPAPPGVDVMFSGDKGQTIDPILTDADFIVLAINLSDATHHLIDAAALARTKPGVIIVNMARGGVMDEVALLAALKSGHVAGAGLDVFETEPLPAESPLWDAPNTLVTPHFTPPVPDRSARSLAIIVENFARFRSGQQLLNRITRDDVYSR